MAEVKECPFPSPRPTDSTRGDMDEIKKNALLLQNPQDPTALV